MSKRYFKYLVVNNLSVNFDVLEKSNVKDNRYLIYRNNDYIGSVIFDFLSSNIVSDGNDAFVDFTPIVKEKHRR